MNRKLIIGVAIASFIGLFLYVSLSQITPEEIENAPDWLTMETAVELASESDEGKLILVDIFEVGCVYCRQMEREVYPSPSIRTLLDRSFYPVKVNGNSETPIVYKGETMTQQQFAALMGVSAFPYTVVLDQEGNVVDRRRGYMGVSDLSRFLNGILRDREAEG